MKTFPHPEVTKNLLVADMIAHREADDFIRGTYGHRDGDDFRGCAVGCSIHTINRVRGTTHHISDHSALADETGAPEWLFWLQDRIFENLPEPDFKEWPLRFWQTFPEGVDLQPALAPILTRILREIALPAVGVDEWGVKDAIEAVCAAIESGDKERIQAAARAAAHAHASAYAAAYAVAYAAVYAAAAARAAARAAASVYAVAAARRQIADIVCEEIARCGEGDLK